MTALTPRRRTAVLVTVCLAVLAINLDTTIVNVALPSLARQLHAGTAAMQWVVDGYALAFAALVLAGGSVGDRLGRRPVLLAGLAGFAAASVGAGPGWQCRRADRLAVRDGCLRRRHLPDHLVDHHERLPGPGRAGQGHRRVGRGHRPGRGRRAGHRRAAAGPLRLGVGVLGAGPGGRDRRWPRRLAGPRVQGPRRRARRPGRAGRFLGRHRPSWSTPSSRRRAAAGCRPRAWPGSPRPPPPCSWPSSGAAPTR